MRQDQLRPAPPFPNLLGSPGIHVLYANLKFGERDTPRKARALLKSVWEVWFDDDRTLRYLEKHQPEFRRCLDWLSKGSEVRCDEAGDDEDRNLGPDERYSRWMDQWHQHPVVQFLQQHGIDHAGIALQPPTLQDGPPYLGLELDQLKPKDPLDPICWHLLKLLMWNGTVNVKRCAYQKCGRFFRPRTARKLFCRDLCRAKDYMENKTPKEKNQYMRKWRRIRRDLQKFRK
jgi:hypothetical protein